MNFFSPMKIYLVFIRAGTAHAQERPIMVREGFNIFAFALTFFWALYHRMWKPLFYISAFNIALVTANNMQLFTQPSLAMVQLAFQVVVGFMACDWMQTKLTKDGYILADISAADHILKAEQRYFERMLAASPQ
jgi:hypothetical protein